MIDHRFGFFDHFDLLVADFNQVLVLLCQLDILRLQQGYAPLVRRCILSLVDCRREQSTLSFAFLGTFCLFYRLFKLMGFLFESGGF